jgi:hypothetical protein
MRTSALCAFVTGFIPFPSLYASARLPPPFQQTGQEQHTLALLESHQVDHRRLLCMPVVRAMMNHLINCWERLQRGGGHHVSVTFLCSVAVRFILMKGRFF